MNSIISACCQNVDVCNLANPIFIKDVFDPSYSMTPAITTLLLVIPYAVITYIGFGNFRKLVKAEAYVETKMPVLMNLFVFLSAFFWFLYACDGPIQLFTNFSGFPPYGIASFQIYAICLFHYCLIFSSYTWLSLTLLYKDLARILGCFLKLFFILDLLFVTAILIATITYAIIEIEDGYQKAFFFLSISSLVNGVFFSICCFLLAGNLKEIYYFDPQQQSKVYILKVYAVFIGLFTLLRSAHDIQSFRDPTWQTTFKVTSFCDTGFEWSIYLLFYNLLTNILPAALFLAIFAPSIRQKGEDSFVKSYSLYMDSEGEEEDGDSKKKGKKYNGL